MQEVVDGLKDLGVSNIEKVGSVVWQDLGPFSIPARFDLIAQYRKDPRYTALKSKLERAFQKYRKIVTGAQASDRELKMLRPLIASFKQRPQVFFTVAQDIMNEYDRQYNDRLALYEAVGRDISKLKGLTSTKPVTPQKSQNQTTLGSLKSKYGLD
jgi:hypothetical protein